MFVDSLQKEVDKLVRSSGFSGNDKLSFKVPILNKEGDVTELPGKFCPAEYLDRIGVKKSPERVAVICPGNGGLVSELFNRGAKSIACFEPRSLYFNGFRSSMRLVTSWRKEVDMSDYQSNYDWPDSSTAGWADLVIFSEGLRETTTPFALLETITKMLSPSGTFIIEFTTGYHTATSGSINSWLPTGAVFETVIGNIEGAVAESLGKGRLDNSVIYKIVNDILVVEEPSELNYNSDNVETTLDVAPTVIDTDIVVIDEVSEIPTQIEVGVETDGDIEAKKEEVIKLGLFDKESLQEALDTFGLPFLDEILVAPAPSTKKVKKVVKKKKKKSAKKTVKRKKAKRVSKNKE